MSGVVTPEAVRLEFEAAGIASRAIALALDLLLQATIIALLLLGLGLVAEGAGAGMPAWAAISITLVLVFAILWGYPVGFETLWRGRTLGKAVMGLRVMTCEGAPVRFRHAAIRAALGFVDFYLAFGGVAVVSALVTREHQRLGDLVAGTLVLRERTGARAPTAVRFAVPSGAESYASTIDTAGLTIGDYATVRGFLLRAGGLRPDVRADLAARIARPVAARLRHRPPDGVSSELFLRCVATRFQQRGSPGARQASGGPVREAAAAGGVVSPATPATPAPRSGPAASEGFAPPG